MIKIIKMKKGEGLGKKNMYCLLIRRYTDLCSLYATAIPADS